MGHICFGKFLILWAKVVLLFFQALVWNPMAVQAGLALAAGRDDRDPLPY